MFPDAWGEQQDFLLPASHHCERPGITALLLHLENKSLTEKMLSTGWEPKNTRLLADKFAASGFTAVLAGTILLNSLINTHVYHPRREDLQHRHA